MTNSKQIRLIGPTQREYAKAQIDQAPDGWTVDIKEPSRSAMQNRKLWPMLKDVSDQVEWHGVHLKPADWKEMFTAGLKGCQVVPGLEGGFVTIGMSTSAMGKKMFADLITYIGAFGDQRGVVWSEPRGMDDWGDV